MIEIRVGIRIDPNEGISFFGIEQVNALINFGGKVTSIEGGSAVMQKTGEGEGSVRLVLSGCDLQVFIDDVGTDDSPAKREHDRVYREGSDLVWPYLRFVGREHRPADSEEAREELDRGIRLLEEALAINPANYAAHWIIGKTWQALSKREEACEAFHKSFLLCKDNPDVAREYMLECLKLGKIDQGIAAAEHAAHLKPENAGLIANLAMAYFLGERLDEAEKTVEKSLAIDPEDEITQNLNDAIADVRSGRKPQPKSMDELEAM